MISLYPDFYHTFQCKAEHCRHTCCQKWTIDIDESTAALYRTLPDPLGESVRDAMTEDASGSHFIFTKEHPTCALLTEEGLCRIVLELGEEGLCDICHNHPRFYKYLENLEFCGIGLSCEAGVEGLLRHPFPQLHFTVETDVEDKTALKNLSKHFTLTDIFQLLHIELAPESLQCSLQITAQETADLLQLYGLTEPIDQDWTDRLNELQLRIPLIIKRLAEYAAHPDKSKINVIYQYILYRQIDMLSDCSLRALLNYAESAARFIWICTVMYGDMNEQIRRWSEQIEYDEDNVTFLFDHFEQQ